MPVEDMQIFGDDARSELGFSAYEAGLRELAVIVENRQVQAALWRRIAGHAGIEVIAPAQCSSLDFDDCAATLGLDAGRRLRARLIVGADGGNSWVRAQAGIAVDARPYAQTAVVANFETALAHRGVARQWFRRDGILALLPLPGNRVSMVWSTREPHADELMQMSAEELAAAVAAASGNCTGALRVITPAAAFPLRLQRVHNMVKAHLALVGGRRVFVPRRAWCPLDSKRRGARVIEDETEKREGLMEDLGQSTRDEMELAFGAVAGLLALVDFASARTPMGEPSLSAYPAKP